MVRMAVRCGNRTVWIRVSRRTHTHSLVPSYAKIESLRKATAFAKHHTVSKGVVMFKSGHGKSDHTREIVRNRHFAQREKADFKLLQKTFVKELSLAGEEESTAVHVKPQVSADIIDKLFR